MKSLKKVVSLILCLVLFAGLITSCDDKETSSDEHVTLRWIFGGPGLLEDSEKVWAEFNERLKDYLPNTTVEFTCIPHADYAEKLRLMNAAQEDMDIVWVSYAQNFIDEVGKDSYMELNDLIDKYGQDMKKDFPEWLLDLTTIDGKIYAIPNYQMMVSPIGFSLPKEHVEKGWLDIEEANKIFADGRTYSKEDMKIFEEYIKKVQASGEDVKYISGSFLSRVLKNIGMPRKNIENVTCNAIVVYEDGKYKVKDALNDYPETYDYYDLVNEWYKKGYIRKDILENPSEVEGNYLLWWTTVFKGTEERLSLKYGEPMTYFEYNIVPEVDYKGSATNTAISANSKHPERAMQLLNLMNSKKGAELLNLLSYGFEGEHYKKIGDNRIEWLGEAVPGASDNKYGYENWALGNALVTYETQHDPEGWNTYIDEEVNRKAKMSIIGGFTLDTDPIKIEIAQYKAVEKEYSYVDKGTSPNYKKLIKERNKKLKDAGSDKIVAEVQRQINEWAKNKK